MKVVIQVNQKDYFDTIQLRSLALTIYPRYVQECRLKWLNSVFGVMSCVVLSQQVPRKCQDCMRAERNTPLAPSQQKGSSLGFGVPVYALQRLWQLRQHITQATTSHLQETVRLNPACSLLFKSCWCSLLNKYSVHDQYQSLLFIK